MSRFRAPIPSISSSLLPAGALAAALLCAAPAQAFFQSTKVEGTLGTDIGGVWLSVQNEMPEFRISFPKPKSGDIIPLEVGPIPAALEPIAGKTGAGVVITHCTDSSFCSTNGLLEGDILVRLNGHDIGNVEDFRKAQENPPIAFLLSVRRSGLRMTTARLLKIHYNAEGKEVDGASVAQEDVDLRVLDVTLPFADKIEAAREARTTYNPSAAEVEAVAKKWFELPASDPPLLVSASHRLVAKDNFDEALSSDRSLANSKVALLMDMQSNPMMGGGAKVIDLYGIEALDAHTMEGNYVSVTIASAPFPISIEFKGRFRMTRIADWSDRDDKILASKAAAKKPAENLSKFKTMPDVPAPGKPSPKASPKAAPKAN